MRVELKPEKTTHYLEQWKSQEWRPHFDGMPSIAEQRERAYVEGFEDGFKERDAAQDSFSDRQQILDQRNEAWCRQRDLEARINQLDSEVTRLQSALRVSEEDRLLEVRSKVANQKKVADLELQLDRERRKTSRLPFTHTSGGVEYGDPRYTQAQVIDLHRRVCALEGKTP